MSAWGGTDIAEAVDGALDDEGAGDEEREHGGDRPGGRERQRPHLPRRLRAGTLGPGHLPLSPARATQAKRDLLFLSKDRRAPPHCSSSSSELGDLGFKTLLSFSFVLEEESGTASHRHWRQSVGEEHPGRPGARKGIGIWRKVNIKREEKRRSMFPLYYFLD